MKYGIDLSHHNKIYDYEKAFANKDFLIIRAGFGKDKRQIDKNLKMISISTTKEEIGVKNNYRDLETLFIISVLEEL